MAKRPKTPEKPEDSRTQREKFIETALEVEAGNSETEFDATVRRVATVTSVVAKPKKQKRAE
jgi:hypothetical protein